MKIWSLTYFAFLTAAWILARSLWSHRRVRQLFLLMVSYGFYSTWGPRFLAVLISSSLLNYLLFLYLKRVPSLTRLVIALLPNLLLLSFFKFLPHTGQSTLLTFGVPVGVSFWTFQSLSSILDAYREEAIDPSLLEFCLFVAFWPTVLSGPVCRLPELLPQFRECAAPRFEDIAAGVKRIIFGLFLKLVLAQILANGLQAGQGVNTGFDQVTKWGGLDVWTLAIAYGMQLYFDFSGYSHIAIGTARLFRIRVPENFKDPFLSTSPSMFWTRWHMSLSYWIRDYLFIPLAAAQRSAWWRRLALLIAMCIFGLWHGATWPFILWGTYHGFLLILHREIQAVRARWLVYGPDWFENFLGWTVTFGAVSLGWILFRAHDLHQAAVMYAALGRARKLSALIS